MSNFIDKLKAQSGDPRSTRELTLIFGDQVAQSGRNDVFQANPDFAQEYASIKDELGRLTRPSLAQEALGGLKAGGSELLAAGEGVGALGAQAVGADSIAQNLLGRARANEADAVPASVPSISAISGDHPVEDTAYYLARGAGSLLPSLGLAAGAGVAGGLIGSAAEPGAGSIAGALGGIGEAFTGEGAAAKLIQMAAQRGITLSAEDAAALAAKQAAQRVGSEAALAGAFSAQSTGANFVRHPETPGADIAFGVGSGVLGALAPGYVAGKLLPGAAGAAVGDLAVAGAQHVPPAYLQRFLTEAAKTIPIGAAGTAGSALIDIAADKYARGENPDNFTQDDWKAALNAGVIGGLGGALMAPFAAIPGQSRSTATQSQQDSATRPIPTDGLPPDVAVAVKTAEAAAEVLNPQPQPSPLREAADNAISQQSTGTLGVQSETAVGGQVGQGNTQPEVAPAARQSGPEAGQAPAAPVGPKQPDPTWKVTIQAADSDQPGYVQVDKINPDGSGAGSFSPEDLIQQGYELPRLDGLQTGQYTIAELLKRQADAGAADQAPRVPSPTAADVMPVPGLVRAPNEEPPGAPRAIGEPGQPIEDSAVTVVPPADSGVVSPTEDQAAAEANAAPAPPAPPGDEQIAIPAGKSARDMVRMSSRIRAIDRDLLSAKGTDRQALLIERLQVGAEMGHQPSAAALQRFQAAEGQPDRNAIIRDVVKKYGITNDKQHVMAGEIRLLRESNIPKKYFSSKGAGPDTLGEGITEAPNAHGLADNADNKLNEGDAVNLILAAFREPAVKEPPRIEIPLVKKEPVVYFTRRLGVGGDPFYSRVIRTVETSQQGRATGEQWKAAIRNSKIGVSRDEMNLLRVDDLDSAKTYSKQDVIDHLRANEVQVREVTFGGPTPPKTPYEIWRDEQAPFVAEAQRKGIPAQDTSEAFYNSLPAQYRLTYEMGSQSLEGRRTRAWFGDYQLHGAEEGSYRETLLTVPDAGTALGTPVGPPVDDGAGGLVRPTVGGKGWRDGHSPYADVVNPVVRLRYNERMTADGKRMLFLEEVQPPQKGEFTKMPEAFQKNWREIAFKWALRKAAAEGYDAIGWTTGDQQAARYDLSAHLSGIDAVKEGSGTYRIFGRSPSGTEVINARVPEEKLAATVGKDLAEKIVSDLGAGLVGGSRKYEGLDLKVGGEGLKKLYDSDFRNVVNNLPAVKRAGQKVGASPITLERGRVFTGAAVHPLNVSEKLAALRDVWHGPNQTPEGYRNWNVTMDAQAEKVIALMRGGASFRDAMTEAGSPALAEKLGFGGTFEMQHTEAPVPSLAITPDIRAAATEGMAVLTQRTSADSLAPTASSARLLDSTVRALAQDRGIPVAPLSQAIGDAVGSAVKTAGVTISLEAGGKIVAYALDSVHGPLAPQSIIALMHEAAHVFTDGLPEPLRVAAHDAIGELPWTAQRWLNNPESLDARLLATADPATLSPLQLDALRQMTPQEIAAARALSPEILAKERMAEHLAQTGWDKQQATTFVDRLFRFVKDLWLQTSMAIQKALKGADQVNPELARQFVENRFLQFINRDAAFARDRINDLRNWIGIPQTTRERQPNFPGGNDADMRMQFADPATGTLIPISYGTYTPDSMRAYLQRSIDNAARFVRNQPKGQQSPEAIEFTKRVNFSKPMPLEPAATYNVKLAALNLEDEIYNQIRENPVIAGLLPREAGKVIEHADFLADWMKLPEQQHPEKMKASVSESAASAVDPLTGKPVASDPAITIDKLPSTTETLIGKEKEAVTIQLSEQQDEALTQTILSLRDTQRRLQTTLSRERQRLNDLIGQRDEQGKEFPASAQKELDELQRTTLVRAELVKALIPRINELDSKFDPRKSVQIYPTGEYPRVPSASADEGEILANRRGVVPRDLNFSSDETKAKLGQDLADMEAWLSNPENRKKGAIYGTIDEAYRKLLQIPTDLKRVNTAVLLRRTITNGLAEELRLTGIPALVAFGKKIIQVARIGNENRVESHNLGVKWEVAFSKFAKALGQEPNQAFRDTWWDPLNRIWDRVDVSRRAELTSPDQWRTPIDQVAKALSEVAGLEIKTPAQREALRDLMLATTDSNRHFMSVELQNDIRVQDDRLGYERRLVPRGIVGGRRTFARHLMGLFARMNPDWSDTGFVSPDDTRSFWEAAGDLYTEDRPTFDKSMDKLFPSYVTDDFVEPWVNDNDPVFPAPKTEEDSAPRMAAANRVRQAWRESGGDVTGFAERLHALEGGDEGDEKQTVANVLRTLRQKFIEQKTAVDQQLGRQQIGSEILPRQLMDARVAHNWPAEHVSYATYTPIDNAIVLQQLAMGAALGRDALGATSEMHMTLAETRRDLAELWARHEELVQQGKSPAQIDAIMGKDDARIARNYWALTENVKNIEKALVGMTMNSGYLLNDFKAMNAAVGFFASMMIQNPRSGAVNIIGDIQGPLAALKFSSQGLRAFKDSSVSVARDMATSIVRAFGIDAKFNADLAHELYVNGAVEPETAVTWRQKQHFGAGLGQTKPASYEKTGAKIGRVITRLASRGREIGPNVGSPFQVPFRAGDEAAAVAPKLRAGFFGTTAMSTQFANNRAGYNLFAQLANRGVQYLNSLPESIRQAVVRELELGTKDIEARQLGYNRGLLLNDEAAFSYLKNAIETQMSGESSVGRFVAKAFRRQEAAKGGQWPILANSQFSDVINLTNSYWTLQNNFATVPPWMNGPLRPLFIFLTWPYQAMHRFGQTFTDPKGRLTFNGLNSTVADGMKTFFLLAAPATIAGSFAIDLYDKYALGKKQNLRDASLATALPGVGAFVDPAAFMERIGRYGSAGFATDLMNRIVNYDTQRNLSLDDRIVAVSSIENLLNTVAVEPFQTGGNITYASTVRPFLQAVGGGGVLQYLQIANNLLGLNNQEAAINAKINTTNALRAAGREIQLPVRTMTGPSEAPTPVSPYTRQMQLAAIINNPELFRAAFQNAVAAARNEGRVDAEKYVITNFLDRHPLRSTFRTAPTEGEYRQLLSLMDEHTAAAVREAVNSYNSYAQNYFGRPAFYGRVEKDAPTVDELIRQASRLSPALDYSLAARGF